MRLRLIKQGLLLFWALWFSIMFLSNLFNGLINLGFFPSYWLFYSGNFAMVANVISRYSSNIMFPAILFAAVLIVAIIVAILFWVALGTYRAQTQYNLHYVRYAFGASIALWAAFLVVDEFMIAYSFEAPYFRLLSVSLLSLFAFYVLPEN